ncbi:ciliary microtubule associated protein 1A-like isoform X1 [Symsagittifera roscoffensis]|uniref:ciliary microtubule associated protein 1A-like isoform X1 n=1 Tax=Symsagittifera roscoffensis TaxID=84072 RepID=UPI00307CC515
MVPEPTRPRGPIAAMYSSPGPCYQLRSVVGAEDHCNSKRKLPSYSIAGRGKQFTDDCSPGPKYNPDGMTNKGKAGAPQPSISGRHADMQQWMTPSPDKYGVDGATKQVYRNAPQYSIGGRTKQSKSDNTPSPNAYSLPTTVGANCVDKSSAPSYGVRSRPNQGGFSEDLQKTPGPGAYKTTDPNVYKQKRPGYSITARNELPSDTTTKPGPGAHKPENVTATRKAAPAFSFGIRHSEYTAPLIAEPTDMD